MSRWLWLFAAPMAACTGEKDKEDIPIDKIEQPPCREIVSVFVDADFDGSGDPARPAQGCPAPGLVQSAEDCDDTDPSVHPDAEELCDGRDNDCDGETDDELDIVTSFTDVDGDGYGDPLTGESSCELPAGRASRKQDCDDHDATVYLDAPEACDGVDNDCDGQIDELLQIAMYVDGDGDGYGNPQARLDACPGTPGLAEGPGDCDDGNSLVYPLAPEECDEVDNDCDGTIDDGVAVALWPDGDSDGFGDPASPLLGCVRPGLVTDGTDCDDSAPTSWPGATEVCDQLDNDCDHVVDNALSDWWFVDADSDGHGNPFSGVETCSPPVGWVTDDTDCDDTDAAIPPSCPTNLPADWTTFGSGPRRDHHAMGNVSGAQASFLWEVEVEGLLEPVSVADGRVYASVSGYFTDMRVVAWDLADGTERWSYEVPPLFGLSGPGFAEEQVCFTACNNYTSELTCLDASDGSIVWTSPFYMQWETYLPPVAEDGVLYSGGGTYGGLYGHLLEDGAEVFFEGLDQIDGWGAAVHDGVVYTWIGEKLRAHSPRTGDELWSLSLGASWFGFDEVVPAISPEGVAVLVGASDVWAVDLAARSVLWHNSLNISAPPAIAGSDVYLVKSDGTVQRRDLQTGAAVDTFAGDSELQAVLVTDDAFVASSLASTFVVDRATNEIVQEIDAGGEPVVANNHLVLVDRAASRVQVWRW